MMERFVCLVTFLFLPLMGKVSLQDIHSGIGDTVILPCIYENSQEITDVFWRYNGSRVVFDILKGKPYLIKQDKIFKNTTEMFFDHVKGNYSLKLKNVGLDHAGTYTCISTKPSASSTVKLVVKEKPGEPNPSPNPNANKQKQNTMNASMEAQSQKILTFLCALLGLTLHLI